MNGETVFALTTVLADTNDWHHHWWWVFPWLVLVLLIVLFVWRRGCGFHRGSSAGAILAERFARGEITAEEYRERRAQLGRRW
jgi:putative membrane protein